MAGDRRKGVLGADQTELAGNMERFLEKEKKKEKDKE